MEIRETKEEARKGGGLEKRARSERGDKRMPCLQLVATSSQHPTKRDDQSKGYRIVIMLM